ncbi:hypothetical protein FHR59_000661 [Xanthomonas arboricola]|uniref:hypothetical protein n=1 Tax=Xanthomonas arboricola TaxID=56448 RepID=UPI0016096266|nr:hypothetical protein [Xanthomonas arboricola]MBB6336451.1 hypothetical protein [Xanthomonas arboricola]
MAFVVEGDDWDFQGKAQHEVLDALDKFFEKLDRAASDKVKVWFGEDFSSRPILEGSSIWDLCAEGFAISIPPEVSQELAAHLGRGLYYVDEPDWPAGFPEDGVISIDGGPARENLDAAWAHHNVRTGKAVACIGLWRNGVFTTATSMGMTNLHWLGDGPAGAAEFWQDAIDVEGNSLASFVRLAPKAYPRLYFFGGVLAQANQLAGGYYANSAALKRHLKILDEAAHWAFTAAPPALSRHEVAGPHGIHPTNQLIERRFTALTLDVSPENPNVYIDRRCREARQITIAGKGFYCEWHCKLEPHRNRIHLHAPAAESEGKVVIAFFAEHLPLP